MTGYNQSEKTHVISPEAHALVSTVAAEIMAHLSLNSSAGDTAMGIWQCWLKVTRDQADMNIVELALERLVVRGDMSMRVLATGERFYYGRGVPASNTMA